MSHLYLFYFALEIYLCWNELHFHAKRSAFHIKLTIQCTQFHNCSHSKPKLYTQRLKITKIIVAEVTLRINCYNFICTQGQHQTSTVSHTHCAGASVTKFTTVFTRVCFNRINIYTASCVSQRMVKGYESPCLITFKVKKTKLFS